MQVIYRSCKVKFSIQISGESLPHSRCLRTKILSLNNDPFATTINLVSLFRFCTDLRVLLSDELADLLFRVHFLSGSLVVVSWPLYNLSSQISWGIILSGMIVNLQLLLACPERGTITLKSLCRRLRL